MLNLMERKWGVGCSGGGDWRMSRLNEMPYGTLQQMPDGRYFKVVKSDNEKGFERIEITEEEYKELKAKLKSMFNDEHSCPKREKDEEKEKETETC